MNELAYLTADVPGIGGVIKERPEDFIVEEQPLYEPTGTGEHLYLFIEKRLRTTSDVIRRLARTFRVSKNDVGYAGLKDKCAVTRQHFSVWLPKTSDERETLPKVDSDHVKVLWATRHANKLRRGHLMRNRFIIHIRSTDPTAAPLVKRTLDRLRVTGVPNFFGHQRFGYRGVNHKLGRLLLLRRWQQMLDLMLGHPDDSDHAPTRAARQAYERRDYATALELLPLALRPDRQALDALRQGKTAQQAVMTIDRHHRSFLTNAFQSAVFNRVLHRRLSDSSSVGINQLVEGDLAWKHDSRAVFAVDHATATAENAPEGRIEALQVSPSGPMWGTGMSKAAGVVAQWERQALTDEELDESDVERCTPPITMQGVRRPMRAILGNPQVAGGADEHGPYVRLSFDLCRGSYATVVLREIMKTPFLEAPFTHDHEPHQAAG